MNKEQVFYLGFLYLIYLHLNRLIKKCYSSFIFFLTLLGFLFTPFSFSIIWGSKNVLFFVLDEVLDSVGIQVYLFWISWLVELLI